MLLRLGMQRLGALRSSLLQEYTETEKEQIRKGQYNFDHPDAFDFDLLNETLKRLKEGKSVEVPIYNFKTHSRDKQQVSFSYKYTCVHTSIKVIFFLRMS